VDLRDGEVFESGFPDITDDADNPPRAFSFWK
jgi:hypothetical protein